ncbi:MAG: hypothetical protein MRY32_01735 [Rickettsiales bacterium]|nr:hypothetical protein [Rickettsiales bacterium]
MAATPDPFAEYAKELFLNALDEDADQRISPEREDLTFLKAFNIYLESEGVEAIAKDRLQNMPSDFALRMSIALDNRALSKSHNPFNSGDHVKPRVQSYTRNTRFGEMLEALYHYVDHVSPKDKPDDNESPHLWKRVVHEVDGKYKSELVRVDHVDPNEHAVVCFSGILAMHHDKRALNGMMKQIEKLLGGPEIYQSKDGDKPYGVYLLSYPDDHRIRYNVDLVKTNADPIHHSCSYAKRFVDEMLIPSYGLDQEPMNEATLKSCMRKMNFFTYSYGAAFVKEVRNLLSDYLHERGFDDAQIKRAFAECYCLNVHPTARIDTPHPCGDFSSVYVVSSEDILAPARADYTVHVPDANKVPSLVPIDDNQLLIWTKNPVRGVAWDKPPQGIASIDGSVVASAGLIRRDAPVSYNLTAGHDVVLGTDRMMIESDEGPQIHDPSYVAFTLRHAVPADHLPDDLVETLLATPEDRSAFPHSGLPPNDFVMQEAIRKHLSAKQNQVGGG